MSAQSDPAAPRSGDSPRDPMDAPIDVTFDGREVLLAVRPPSGDEAPATVDEAIAVLKRSPLTRIERVPVESVIAEQSGTAVPVGEVTIPAETEGWFIAVSPDRLAAYLVPAPPPEPPAEAGDASPPDDDASPADDDDATPADDHDATPTDEDATPVTTAIESSAIDRKRRELGITSGVLQDVVDSFDPPRELTEICYVAQGRPPVEGRHGVITWLLDSDEEEHAPVEREDGSVDHHSTPVKRFVEEGAPLARRQPPVMGEDGEDIFGETIEARPVRNPALDEIAGENTEVRGEELVAKISGLPRAIGEKINVLLVYEVSGDLDYSVGNIEFAGDVVIRGDMKPGFSIVATGSVTIQGMTEHATIRAGGDITVQGVVGTWEFDGEREGEHEDQEFALDAGGDLTAQYLNSVLVRAGGEIQVNREIVNCALTAARVTTASRGRIVGGEITATSEISGGSLGSQQGVPTRLSVPAATAEGPSVVRAAEAVHDGVKIHVGTATLSVDEELAGASFWQLDHEVVRLDSHADVAALKRFAAETDRSLPAVVQPDEAEDGETDEAADAA